jgi:hypothetical protein
MECAGLVGEAVGTESFAPDALEIMELLIGAIVSRKSFPFYLLYIIIHSVNLGSTRYAAISSSDYANSTRSYFFDFITSVRERFRTNHYMNIK